MVLDGVLPKHVFWNVGGEVQVAAGASLSGVVLAAGTIALSGLHLGYCALLSEHTIVLTDLSATGGTNQFYALQSTLGSCTGPGYCAAYSRPPGELVTDGSFEVARCAPTQPGGLVENLSLGQYANTCFWRSATQSTPDYFQVGGSADWQVPTNSHSAYYTAQGYGPRQQITALAQNSDATNQTGQAYAGIYAHLYDLQTYQEYVYQDVAAPAAIQTTHRYYGAFYARISPGSGYTVPELHLAVVEPGLYPNNAISGPIRNVPADVSGAPNLLNSQGIAVSAWVKIGAVFTPQRNFNNGFTVLIGNLAARGTTKNGPSADATVTTPTNPYSAGNEAYYYLDNVTLSMVTEAGDPVALSAACGRTSATLGTLPMPTMAGATYAWTASPADPSLTANVANPTVSPAQTTTYTLTVSIPGQTQTYASSVTVTVSNSGNYAQAAGATYVAPAGLGAADIGDPSAQVFSDGCHTFGGVIDASQAPYNGTVTFAGTYHVRSSIQLKNGTFNVTPGTVFYVDGYGHQTVDCDRIIIRVDNGTLNLTGATLRATCDELWQGIQLGSNARLNTSASGSLHPVIRDAQWAVWRNWDVYDDNAPGGVTSYGNSYGLSSTYFLNNLFNIVDGARGTASAASTISDCTFSVDQTASPLMQEDAGTYSSTGLYFWDYSEQNSLAQRPSSVQVSNCTFSNLHTGIYGASCGAIIAGSQFTNCWYAAVYSPTLLPPPYGAAASYPGRPAMTLNNNTITLPGSYPAGYTTGTPTSYGVQALGGVSLTGNTLGRAAGSTLPATGVDLGWDGILTGNTLQNLTTGLVAASGDNAYGNHYRLTQNRFTDNQTGVSFRPIAAFWQQDFGHGTNVTVDVTLRCNTFESTRSGAYGVEVQQNTRFASVLGSASVPNGNRFDGIPGTADNRLHNLGNLLQYYGYNNPSQELDPNSPPYNVTVNANAVGTCGGTTGVNRQASSPTTASNQRTITSTVNNSAVAQRLTAEQETPYQQAYQQVLAHLQAAARPGRFTLSATDKQTLARVAASSSVAAYSACQLLQFYDPNCGCSTNNKTVPTPARPTLADTAPAAFNPLLGEAHPNPASETVAFRYQLPAAASPATLVVRDLTGRPVLSQAVSTAEGEVVLSVRGLAAGLYLATLEVAGRPLATRKLAVTR